jgi:hypothetical protein
VKLGGILIALAAASSASAAAAADEPICADRPGKANPSCTVPPGMVQVETAAAGWSRDGGGDSRSEELDIGATAVKFGLGDRLHLEIDVAPFVEVRSRDGALRNRRSGFGDSGIALKYRLTSNSAPVQAALYPFAKFPTARHGLGNGRLEGGMALLVDGSFGTSAVGWNVAPQVDLIADGDGSGYHLGSTQAVSIGAPLGRRFTISGDLWGSWNFDPAGTVRQYSADAAAALLVRDDLQLDAGVNVGLNREAADIEIYSGIALRF